MKQMNLYHQPSACVSALERAGKVFEVQNPPDPEAERFVGNRPVRVVDLDDPEVFGIVKELGAVPSWAA